MNFFRYLADRQTDRFTEKTLLRYLLDGGDDTNNGTRVATDLYSTIQYNIRLLHRSQTATTSNMKQMNTKYNSRIT